MIGRLRIFLFDFCVKCGVGVSEAVGGGFDFGVLQTWINGDKSAMVL